MSRIYNFSAGPATLAEEVLQEARDELLDYQGSGMSIMEASHRGKEYSAVHEEAIANIRELLEIPQDYSVLFMSGGASTQFALVPMNLRPAGVAADYIHSGSWAGKAIKEAAILGETNIVANTSKEIPARMPEPGEINTGKDAAYLHLTSNETISGAQWQVFPEAEAPLVADMSSDILSRPIDVADFGLIYAGAQKNLGPAGVTLVILRNDLADRAGDHLPAIFRYRTHIEQNSLYNTPPCFPIYVLMLVTRWLKRQGGVAAMEARNIAKAKRLYDAIDATDFYRGTAKPEYRSTMNVTWRLPLEDLESEFIAQAGKQGMKGLKGHRSVGGVRASIYNSFPEKGIDELVSFMAEFEKKHG